MRTFVLISLFSLSVSAPNLIVLRQLQQSGTVSNTDQGFVPGDDDLVRNILQDLANDPSRLRSLRRFALAGSGSALINDGDNGRLSTKLSFTSAILYMVTLDYLILFVCLKQSKSNK